jgi:hypothetical protein
MGNTCNRPHGTSDADPEQFVDALCRMPAMYLEETAEFGYGAA